MSGVCLFSRLELDGGGREWRRFLQVLRCRPYAVDRIEIDCKK
ncbi:hypothetical protein [Brevibacillus massiliensis]|nr:hypothetical protein [Brevibacillus massiliensis]